MNNKIVINQNVDISKAENIQLKQILTNGSLNQKIKNSI